MVVVFVLHVRISEKTFVCLSGFPRKLVANWPTVPKRCEKEITWSIQRRRHILTTTDISQILWKRLSLQTSSTHSTLRIELNASGILAWGHSLTCPKKHGVFRLSARTSSVETNTASLTGLIVFQRKSPIHLISP